MREDRRGACIAGEDSTADWKPADDVAVEEDELVSLEDGDDSEPDGTRGGSGWGSGKGVGLTGVVAGLFTLHSLSKMSSGKMRFLLP